MFFRLLLGLSTLALTFALSSHAAHGGYNNPYVPHNDRVLLTNVESLLFQPNQLTTGRRSSPVEQMHCSGWNCHNGPNSIMCKNEGMSDKDVVWKCTGQGLTPGYVMKGATVSCEGYANPNDPYILRGSCGVTYTVDKDYSYHEPVTISTTTTSSHYDPYAYHHYNRDANVWDFLVFFFVVALLVGFLLLIGYSSTNAPATVHHYDRYDNYPRTTHVWYNPGTWSWYNRPYYAAPTPTYGRTTTTSTTVNRTTGGGTGRDPTTSTTYAGTTRR